MRFNVNCRSHDTSDTLKPVSSNSHPGKELTARRHGYSSLRGPRSRAILWEFEDTWGQEFHHSAPVFAASSPW